MDKLVQLTVKKLKLFLQELEVPDLNKRQDVFFNDQVIKSKLDILQSLHNLWFGLLLILFVILILILLIFKLLVPVSLDSDQKIVEFFILNSLKKYVALSSQFKEIPKVLRVVHIRGLIFISLLWFSLILIFLIFLLLIIFSVISLCCCSSVSCIGRFPFFDRG